jgi:hypothetical protein
LDDVQNGFGQNESDAEIIEKGGGDGGRYGFGEELRG